MPQPKNTHQKSEVVSHPTNKNTVTIKHSSTPEPAHTKASLGGRADLTFPTSPSDTARANKGVFSVGGEQMGSKSVQRTTKFFVGPKWTSTDSTVAAGLKEPRYGK